MKEQIFEQILEERLGFGKHQIRQFSIISFIDFLDGAEFLFLSLLVPTLKREWDLSMLELVIFGSSFNFGLMIGSTICGFLADQIGRKNILILGTLLQTLVVLFTVIARNIIQMTILRLTYGIVIGMNLPISSILMIEVTPKQHRGKVIVALQIMILLGKCWIMILGYIFMDGISSGNWRAISFCNSIPCLICFIGTMIWIQESPRFLIMHDDIQKGLDNLNKIGHFNNNKFVSLSNEEIQAVIEWQQDQKEQHKMESNSIKQLFNKENLPVTWRNYSIFFLFMFIMLSILTVIPFILDDENKSLSHLYVIDFGELPAIFLMLYTIDNYGRLSTLIFSTTILILILAFIWLWRINIIIFGLIVFKFCCKINWGTLNVLFAESYHTLYRTLGVGTTMAMGRIAGSIVPFVIYPIYFSDNYLTFILCSGLSLIVGILLIFYPIDLTKKPLDQLKLKD